MCVAPHARLLVTRPTRRSRPAPPRPRAPSPEATLRLLPPAGVRRAAAYALAATAPLLAACGGGSSDGGTTVEPTPFITLTAETAALSVPRGANATTTITVARGGGFGGDVALAAALSGSPPGLSAVVSPATVASNASTSTLTVTTTGSTPAGTYQVVVTGFGTGVLTASAAVNLTVTAPASQTALGRGTAGR